MVAAHILVVGATGEQSVSKCFCVDIHILINHLLGPSGLAFCSAALEEGHQLTLYVRNSVKLPTDISGNAKVAVIQGTLQDESGLRRAIESGATVFVSFAGPVASSKGTVRLTGPIFQDHLFVSCASWDSSLTNYIAHHRCDEADIPTSDC